VLLIRSPQGTVSSSLAKAIQIPIIQEIERKRTQIKYTYESTEAIREGNKRQQ